MVAENVEQMRRIAQATAAKMARAGYVAEMIDTDTYSVTYIKDGKRVEYRVQVNAPVYCGCKFFEENYAEYGEDTVCKHLLFAWEQRALDAWADELEAQWGNRDATEFGDHYQAASPTE